MNALGARPIFSPKAFLISPPFGNWIGHPKATRILGSFTLERRPGWWRRAALTVRPTREGWVNRIGLRNPGVASIDRFDPDAVYSLAALRPEEWWGLAAQLPDGVNVEVNLGCPNGGEHVIPEAVLRDLAARCGYVAVKLPPTWAALGLLDTALACGVRTVHLCNTLPTPRGGESGHRLRRLSLVMVREARRRFGRELRIVGGGGIYAPEHATAYRDAGADHLSLATVWFAPRRALALLGGPAWFRSSLPSTTPTSPA